MTVQVSDGSLTDAQAISVRVIDVNEAPVVGFGPLRFSVAENTTTVGTISALDPDGQPLTYSFVPFFELPFDQAAFTINPTTGALSFSGVGRTLRIRAIRTAMASISWASVQLIRSGCPPTRPLRLRSPM
ncbi:cadherin repeat domain-containing protein [Hankyongella ginsenosidimutans]|uniref:Cadherin repeat domain-containing protein n=1 Tax=Hankyongella ginsenosidimutans TaxID=1763828 RepID=A0A4D7BYE3_9SPHN|nr:cadherin repeat domain-containing protein [Hankyongella ginsenosidimutans]QCI80369.1 cadherin repeat domain-containing protein [Hankyongella ginsenosidimutans]